MKNLENKVILTVAPTGAWPSKSDTPHIPLQPKEIVEDVSRQVSIFQLEKSRLEKAV